MLPDSDRPRPRLSLFQLGVDYLLVPNVLDSETDEESSCPSHLCPWNQTLPYVLRAAPRLEEHAARMLAPTVHFQMGAQAVKDALAPLAQKLGARRRASDAAVDAAYRAQREFDKQLLDAGRRALAELDRTGEPGIILLGRSYNLYDRNINCDVPRKLRQNYGANVIPLDFLVTGRESVADLHPNMYWASGRKILEAARLAGFAAQPARDLRHQFQVRARFLHQTLCPPGRRSPLAGAPIRWPRQRCRLYDALRSVPGQ